MPDDTTKCYATEDMFGRKDGKAWQCCCHCVSLLKATDGKTHEDAGWVCTLGGDHAYTNWYEHSVGCEMFCTKDGRNSLHPDFEKKEDN